MSWNCLSDYARMRTQQFVGRVVSLLAVNQRIEVDVFRVDFPFDDRMVRAQATFVSGDEILIGTRLLRDYRLRIDLPARSRHREGLT